jgi:hypothetical protein
MLMLERWISVEWRCSDSVTVIGVVWSRGLMLVL